MRGRIGKRMRAVKYWDVEKLRKGLQKDTERGWECIQAGSVKTPHPLPHHLVNLPLLSPTLKKRKGKEKKKIQEGSHSEHLFFFKKKKIFY